MFVTCFEIKLKEMDEDIPVSTTEEIHCLFYHKGPANETMDEIHASHTRHI
jgi:hypothetical protein